VLRIEVSTMVCSPLPQGGLPTLVDNLPRLVLLQRQGDFANVLDNKAQIHGRQGASRGKAARRLDVVEDTAEGMADVADLGIADVGKVRPSAKRAQWSRHCVEEDTVADS
jgi:hypothetical protein